MPIKSEIKQESDATIQKVEEDRGLSIQVTIPTFCFSRKNILSLVLIFLELIFICRIVITLVEEKFSKKIN